MTVEEKVVKLRKEGLGYKKIANELNIGRESVRYYCQKHQLTGVLATLDKSTCKKCGSIFDKKATNQIYCSDECIRENQKIKYKRRILFKNCTVCDKVFTPLQRAQKRCPDCVEQNIYKSTCKRCDKDFISGGQGVVCSSCKNKKKMKVRKTCKECGSIFEVPVSSTQKFCAQACFKKNTSGTHEDFMKKIIEAHKGKIVPLELYHASNEPIKLLCLECNDTVVKRPIDAIRRGCLNCSNGSKHEDKIAEYLKENGYEFQRQYTVEGVEGLRALRFDFAVFKENEEILIEYDGEQHFKPIKAWGGKEEFQRIKERDSLKNKYAEETNTKLIRIPYFKQDEIETILLEEL